MSTLPPLDCDSINSFDVLAVCLSGIHLQYLGLEMWGSRPAVRNQKSIGNSKTSEDTLRLDVRSYNDMSLHMQTWYEAGLALSCDSSCWNGQVAPHTYVSTVDSSVFRRIGARRQMQQFLAMHKIPLDLAVRTTRHPSEPTAQEPRICAHQTRGRYGGLITKICPIQFPTVFGNNCTLHYNVSIFKQLLSEPSTPLKHCSNKMHRADANVCTCAAVQVRRPCAIPSRTCGAR
eukprot:5774663-Amphidinium_carterae.1